MAYKKKYTFKIKRKGTKRYKKTTSLKRQLLRMHEVKEIPFQDFLRLMSHQTYYQFSPTQQIVPGNTGTTRVGDEVYLTSLQLSGFFQTSSAADSTCKFRCTIFWSTNEVAAPGMITNGITGNSMWHTGTDAIVVNAISNPNAVTILADFVIDASQINDGSVEFKSFNIEVPLKQTYKYRAPGSAYGKTKNLYVSFNGFIHAGINGVTDVGRVSCASVLKFKDP